MSADCIGRAKKMIDCGCTDLGGTQCVAECSSVYLVLEELVSEWATQRDRAIRYAMRVSDLGCVTRDHECERHKGQKCMACEAGQFLNDEGYRLHTRTGHWFKT